MPFDLRMLEASYQSSGKILCERRAGVPLQLPERDPGSWLRLKGCFYILKVSYFWYIDMSSMPNDSQSAVKRVRLNREDRLRKLLDVAWQLAREEGTDALTLPRMADEAGVTKPVIYDHFGTRNGLLTALYQDFDVRQTAVIDAALEACEPTVEGTARVIASSYVECVLAQGREIPSVLAGLAGSPELEAVKRDYQQAFIEKCRKFWPHSRGQKVSCSPAFGQCLAQPMPIPCRSDRRDNGRAGAGRTLRNHHGDGQQKPSLDPRRSNSGGVAPSVTDLKRNGQTVLSSRVLMLWIHAPIFGSW